MRRKGLRIGIDARVLGSRGVGRYLSSLLGALSRLDHPHRFTLFLQRSSRAELVPRDPRFEAVELKGWLMNPVAAEQRVIPERAARLGLQVLHFPDNSGPVAPGLPLVLTMHDTMWRRPLAEAIARPTLRQRLQDLYRKAVCPAAARAAARIITVSGHSRASLVADLGLPPAKITLIPEGVDPCMAARLPAARAARLLRGLGLRGPYVLASGAADKRKNIDRLMEAFALAAAEPGPLAKAGLALTSLRTGEAETTTYAATARRLGIAARVNYLGYVSDEELKALYQGALCFAFPSLWEGFGLPLLEAQALGCPVLAARAGALPEVGGRGAVYADPGSAAGLAHGLAAAAGKAGRAAARLGRGNWRRFSWDRAARATLRAYEAAAGAA